MSITGAFAVGFDRAYYGEVCASMVSPTKPNTVRGESDDSTALGKAI